MRDGLISAVIIRDAPLVNLVRVHSPKGASNLEEALRQR